MMKHTPGPWKIEQHTHAEVYAGSILIADVMTGKDSADGCGKANARLIAETPAMRESLAELFDIVENEIGYRADSEDAHEREYARRMMRARGLLARIDAAKD